MRGKCLPGRGLCKYKGSEVEMHCLCSRNKSRLLGWNEGRGEAAKGQIIWCLKTVAKTLFLIKVGDGLDLCCTYSSDWYCSRDVGS